MFGPGALGPPESSMSSEPPSTPFDVETAFPPVISSYCTKTDDGRGEERMWQLANFLKQHGVASFNGKQVRVGEDWVLKLRKLDPKDKSS